MSKLCTGTVTSLIFIVFCKGHLIFDNVQLLNEGNDIESELKWDLYEFAGIDGV